MVSAYPLLLVIDVNDLDYNAANIVGKFADARTESGPRNDK